MARNTTRIPYVLPVVLMVLLGKPGLNQGFPHRSLLETCRPNGAINSKTDHSCNTENESVCCKAGQNYSTYDCSPPVTGRTPASLMLNSFAEGGDGGAASECTGEFYSDDKMVAALSTGWYNRGSRCGKYVQIRANGRSVKAMVVDECDSMHGCDADHNYGPPCENNVVNGSPAVWDALGLNRDAGEVQITWSDEQRHICNAISYS